MDHVQEQMKAYCRSQNSCLRNFILKYLGFSGVTQERCCCICDGTGTSAAKKVSEPAKPKVRTLLNENKILLKELILSELNEFDNNMKGSGIMLLDCSLSNDKDLEHKMIEGIEYIKTEADLLDTYGIWDETCSSKIFLFITKYAPLIQESTSSV